MSSNPFQQPASATSSSSSSSGSSSSASGTSLSLPPQPGSNATEEEKAKYKIAVQQYLVAVKAERARVEAENAAKAQQQQQQQQKPKPTYEVEVVYADEVGYEDYYNNNEEYEDEADEAFFENFAKQNNKQQKSGDGEAEEVIDEDAYEAEKQKRKQEQIHQASQSYQGKEIDADDLFRIAKTASIVSSSSSSSSSAVDAAFADFFGIEAELVARDEFDLNQQRDSFGRGVLHFAAEGGNTAIVSELRKRLGDQSITTTDDKGMCPWQAAVLSRNPEAAKLLFPSPNTHSFEQASMKFSINSPEDLASDECFSAVLQFFAPKTIQQVLAFGAKPPQFSENHLVWGVQDPEGEAAKNPIPGVKAQSISCGEIDAMSATSLEAFDSVCSSFGNYENKQAGGLSLAQWAQPRTAVDFASRQKFAHLMAAFDQRNLNEQEAEQGANGPFVGAAVFFACGMLAGKSVPTDIIGRDVYYVAHAAVSPSAPPHTLRQIMRQSHSDYQGTAVFVRTAAKLPASMGQHVAQIKWMYRIVRPWNIFHLKQEQQQQQQSSSSSSSSSSTTACPLRSMLCSDYDKFSNTSLVDTVVRHAVSSSYPMTKSELSTWQLLPWGPSSGEKVSEAEADAVAQVVCRVVNEEGNFGVHWNGPIVKALLEAEDLRFVVRRNPQQQITDLLLFTIVPAAVTNNNNSTSSDVNSTFNMSAPVAGILSGVFAPTVAKGRRAVVSAGIAGVLVGCDVLFSSNTFGLANADLVNAFFSDLPGSLERIYCLAGTHKTLHLPAASSASGVYVPFL